MPALGLLIVIGIGVVSIAISPFFPAIGGVVTSLWENATGVDDKNQNEKENKK